MHWRRLRGGEIDHEMLWLSVSVVSGGLAWLWIRLGGSGPVCPLHAFTGWPCLTCGATRAVRAVFRGNFLEALCWNPLVIVGLGMVLLFDLYALIVVGFGLPRLRFEDMPQRIVSALRVGVIVAILINWGWLIYRRI